MKTITLIAVLLMTACCNPKYKPVNDGKILIDINTGDTWVLHYGHSDTLNWLYIGKPNLPTK